MFLFSSSSSQVVVVAVLVFMIMFTWLDKMSLCLQVASGEFVGCVRLVAILLFQARIKNLSTVRLLVAVSVDHCLFSLPWPRLADCNWNSFIVRILRV